jgi:hypothetical protein
MGRLLDENDVYALFAPNGTARLHVADIDVLPRVDAVKVHRLGKLGRLMMPYKGCPRGRMGARGCSGEDFKVLELDPIMDVDGNRWIPVLEEDLRVMKARVDDTVKLVHGRWENITGGMITLGDCSECKVRQPMIGTNYCKNCGAKMDLED